MQCATASLTSHPRHNEFASHSAASSSASRSRSFARCSRIIGRRSPARPSRSCRCVGGRWHPLSGTKRHHRKRGQQLDRALLSTGLDGACPEQDGANQARLQSVCARELLRDRPCFLRRQEALYRDIVEPAALDPRGWRGLDAEIPTSRRSVAGQDDALSRRAVVMDHLQPRSSRSAHSGDRDR